MPILAPGRVPTTPDPIAEAAIRGLRMVWHGWDGSDWVLGGDEASGVQHQAGTRGFTLPTMDWYTLSGAGADGHQDTGYRANSREVFWPLSVWHGGMSQEWFDYDRAFWRTLQPGRYGTWQVIQPGGEARTLRLRIEDDGSPAFSTDPALVGWYKYGITLTAGQPFWEGEPEQRAFGSETGGSFFDATRYISSSFTLAQAAIPNRGDVPASMVWTIQGPCTSATVGVSGHVITAPITLTGSDSLVIDTHPTEFTAILNGTTDVTNQLGAFDPVDVPAGESVPLSILMTGTGSVTAALTPKFWRAW